MKPLKIALIADPELPVPPLLYGGIERIIDMLIEGYVNLGHEVSLFAHSDSKTKAKLFPYRGKTSHRKTDIVKNAFLINKELYNGNYDIVHSFGRLLYLLPQLPLKIPKLMSYQREPSISQIKKAAKIAKKNTLAFTGCSAYISNQITPHAPAYPIFNGVDLSIYNFKEAAPTDAPLVFLGRIEPIKGTHIAIEVAKRTGKKLIIAGNIPSKYQGYFDTQIKPELSEQITYIGPVNDTQKNDLLGKASAFLMPIEWNEPFGIVMAEAMACGTPVIGFNRGSVPEIIINGKNGYQCTNCDQMIDYVKKIHEISRKDVRKDAEQRFSSEVIIQQYINLYTDRINQNE
ncbi:glycosyltransferase involved in cell wall biosynthesis [Pedobacter sp. AK013]|uniref:glycosyltransferase family 4 protein n=1 Tax=Pedobacter sp. AK013 TaxID=2723071 RepID=UPI0016086F4B|nr:glycosyltransferase family 4 protein [Pedobacter sp. AK013]MBB6235500.1 glycosyltransferase involved in cell wall biosynthesis [Pedobacter sp. AK013]